MPRYLSAARIRMAVERLRQSRASGGMVNFLILKRALALSHTGEVALSLRDECFQQAITELTWWPADAESTEQRPFVDVFGSMNAKNYGMKKQKYRSNGPADTLKNGAWNPVVAVSEGDRSKVATLQDDYRIGLTDLTILKDGHRPMPRIRDAAAWYFRGRDIEQLISELEEDEPIEAKLVDQFCNDLQLSDEDVEILFVRDDDANE